jgi:hypothetical protein
MSKLFWVSATVEVEMFAVVEGPDSMKESELIEYFRECNPNCKFYEVPYSKTWNWGDAVEVPDVDCAISLTIEEDEEE